MRGCEGSSLLLTLDKQCPVHLGVGKGGGVRNLLNDCPSCIEDGKDSVPRPEYAEPSNNFFFWCQNEFIPVLTAQGILSFSTPSITGCRPSRGI